MHLYTCKLIIGKIIDLSINYINPEINVLYVILVWKLWIKMVHSM